MRASVLLAGAVALCPSIINASPVNVGGDTHDVSQLVTRNTNSAGGPPVEPNKESFWKSCDQCRLIGGGDSLSLKCRCLKENNRDIRYSTLNLNKCIGSNIKGELIWEKNGWFTKSCTQINGRFYKGDLLTGPAQPAIHAKCKATQPVYDDILGRSSLELYDKIHNHNGNLWCGPDIETALDNHRKDKDGYWDNLRGPGRR